MTGELPMLPEAPPISVDDGGDRGVEVARWPIYNMSGKLLAWHVRFDLPDGGKMVPWYLPDGVTPAPPGSLKPGPAGFPLYGMIAAADLPDGQPAAIVICEGEKAADALRKSLSDLGRPVLVLGTVTAGVPTASALAPIVEVHRRAGSRYLRPNEREPIYLWPDADDKQDIGIMIMNRLGAALLNAGGSDDPIQPGAIRVIEWTDGITKGADAHDWMAGGCRPPFVDLMQAAIPFGVEAAERKEA